MNCYPASANATDERRIRTIELHGESVPLDDFDAVQNILETVIARSSYSPEKCRRAVQFARLWLATWDEHCAIMDRQKVLTGSK